MLGDWGLREKVKFTGNVPNSTMPRFYAASDVAVLPSLMEATSISGLEAMSAGLPLIGTNIGGIPEIIEHERSGILIEPRSAEQLAAQIVRLLTDGNERRRLGAAARARVEEHFSWDVIAGRTVEVYRKVLVKRGRAR
jgi:glycosyltransferase involved in cell wall biosynthesis